MNLQVNLLPRLNQLKDMLQQEARMRPDLAQLLDLINLQKEFKETKNQLSDELRRQRKKSLKYQQLLASKPAELIEQRTKVQQLRKHAEELKAQLQVSKEQTQNQELTHLRHQIKCLDQSLACIFKSYEIAQKKVERCKDISDYHSQSHDSKSSSENRLNFQSMSIRSTQVFKLPFEKRDRAKDYLTSRTQRLDSHGWSNDIIPDFKQI